MTEITKERRDAIRALIEKRAKDAADEQRDPRNSFEETWMWHCVEGELREVLKGIDALYAATPAAEPVKVKSLEWIAPQRPNSYCSYNHTFADTPFGRYLIDWKAWKDYPTFTIELHGDMLPGCGAATLEDAKAAAQADYERRIRRALVSEKEAE